MAMNLRKDGRVCMTWFGDGATSSNDFHTGMNFAGVFRAPVIFACVNNQWAISCGVRRQTAVETLAVKAEAYGIPGLRVDGNDVLAVYEAARQAVERARAGRGPAFIELLTFRMGPHSSSDDPSRYRPRSVEEEWAAKDPIMRFEAFLQKEGLLAKDAIEAIHAEAETEMAEAAKAAESKPSPALDSLFDDVYSSLPLHLLRQREELRAEGGVHAADEDAAFPL
jgi:TPP-dependent pyruvate/acetoin dehydrogenase alpha subunit